MHNQLLHKCSLGLSILTLALATVGVTFAHAQHTQALNVRTAFDQATRDTGVPASLLEALCYMEGRLSNHSGSSSIDGGYGCMHLIENEHAHTLDQAATKLGVSSEQLKTDLATNIRGGAAVLREYALQLSSNNSIPNQLADWYGTIAAYSNATTLQTAHMYADGVYSLLNKGFSADTDTGETITLAAQTVKPNTTLPRNFQAAVTLPSGCVNDGQTDYPGAVNCIINPATFNCNPQTGGVPCTYEAANRPTDLPLKYIVIHDIEGTVQDALNVFQNVNHRSSIHYIVDSDGTVYQILHEKDTAYQAGNYWYNQRSIGIEHSGFDATGFQWYNASEYLASAKLTAYLLKKYHIPLDHDHVVAHGTVPAPLLASAPNHVDPGPYWLWDYYFEQIHKQGVPFPLQNGNSKYIITLHPQTALHPNGTGGTETAANFNFFYLYNGPSTASGLAPGVGSDVTSESNNVEPGISYYYLAKVKDPAGSGNMLYEIWYGEFDHRNDATPSYFSNAKLAWLAVPPDAAREGNGTLVTLNLSGASAAKIYGEPQSSDSYVIGNAANNAIFVATTTVTETGTTNTWYAINYNHRQSWVPASEATTVQAQII